MRSWQLASTSVPLDAVAADQVVQGSPSAGAVDLVDALGVTAGVWELSEGVVTDVEVDELSLVLSGRGTVEIDDGQSVDLGPGVLLRLRAGDRTRWTVHERLRKLYLVAGPGA